MEDRLAACRDILARTFPDLHGERWTLLTEGWDSLAVEMDGQLIFKFPRDRSAELALVREHAVLARVRPRLAMRVPVLSLHMGPPLFSRHEMIPGAHLTAEDSPRLSEAAREALGEQLGRFYAELHAIPPEVFADLPPAPAHEEPTPDEVAEGLAPVLPADLQAFARSTLLRWRELPPDPHGEVFGFFDGHGWNMAFDHQRQVLNGLYDFADARTAPLQQEFIYSNFISRDLTRRIIAAYERRAGREIDRARVDLLFGVLLLKEVAGWEEYPDKLPRLLGMLRAWALAV